MVWNLDWKINRNDNVAVLHMTPPRAFQRSQGDVNFKDVKTGGLGLINIKSLVASSLNT